MVTFCPTVAETVVTGQVIEPLELELLVDPPAPDVVAAELTISADMPNLSP